MHQKLPWETDNECGHLKGLKLRLLEGQAVDKTADKNQYDKEGPRELAGPGRGIPSAGPQYQQTRATGVAGELTPRLAWGNRKRRADQAGSERRAPHSRPGERQTLRRAAPRSPPLQHRTRLRREQPVFARKVAHVTATPGKASGGVLRHDVNVHFRQGGARGRARELGPAHAHPALWAEEPAQL